MGHDSLINRYKTNFNLMQHYNYKLEDLNIMMPWERYVYLDLIKEYLKQKKEEERDRIATLKAQGKKR